MVLIRQVIVTAWTMLLVAGLPAAADAGQSVRAYTLDEVQRLTLSHYETVRTAGEQIEQARLVRRVAGSVILPTVSATSELTRNLITQAFRFGEQTIEVIPPNDYTLAINVSQPIFAGLRELKARRQADLGIAAARESFASRAQDALLDATRGYYQVLTAQENVDISRRALAVAEAALRTAQSLHRAGEAVETAVLRARVAVTDARRELLEAENGLALSKQQLALLAGLADEFQLSRPARPVATGVPIAELTAAGLKTRPELHALEQQRRIAELEVEKRRGQYLPVVRADGTYIRRRSPFPSNQLSSLSINATWTIFNGGRTAAEVAAAESQFREASLRLELARKQTEQQIRAAYLNVETLSASADMLTAQVEFARRNAEATDAAFRVGEATDLDLLEANATMTRSERQLAVTAYRLDVAMYELQRAIGTFGTEMVATAAGGAE